MRLADEVPVGEFSDGLRARKRSSLRTAMALMKRSEAQRRSLSEAGEQL